MRKSGIVVLLAGLGLQASCSKNWIMDLAMNKVAVTLRTAKTEGLDRIDDLALAREGAAGQLMTLEGLVAKQGGSADLHQVLAQSYLEYAFGFLEEDLESLGPAAWEQREQLRRRATLAYDKARGHALRVLEIDLLKPSEKASDCHGAVRGSSSERGSFMQGFERALRSEDLKSVATVAGLLQRIDLPRPDGLFFTALAMGLAANLNREDLSRTLQLPKVVHLLKRVIEMEQQHGQHGQDCGLYYNQGKFYHGGAAMFLGVYYASLPPALGRDLERSRGYFEQALAENSYLMWRVMQARYYYTATGERERFVQALRDVVSAPPPRDAPGDPGPARWDHRDEDPYRLSNLIAQQRAQRLLRCESVDQLFGKDEHPASPAGVCKR